MPEDVGERSADRAAQRAIRDLDAATAEALRIDRVEAQASRRVEALSAAIRACRAEILHSDDAELLDALESLLEDLDRIEETLPLERAFRADARERALSRAVAAQAELRRLSGGAGDTVAALPEGPVPSGECAAGSFVGIAGLGAQGLNRGLSLGLSRPGLTGGRRLS